MESSTEMRKQVFQSNNSLLNSKFFSASSLLINLSLLYIFTVINFFIPIIRFDYALLNYLAVIFAMLIPLILIFNGLRFQETWLKLGGMFLFIPLALGSLLFAAIVGFGTIFIIQDGHDASFERIKSIQLQSSNLVVYRTNGGATTDYGLVIRQQKQILPGLSFVRDLHNQYRCYDVPQYKMLNESSIELDLDCANASKLTLTPKRFIYF
jgi:hypothetical protein